MTTTPPILRSRTVTLGMLIALRERQSHDVLSNLLDRRSIPRRSAAGTVGAILCVLVVIAIYTYTVSRLGVPVGADAFSR